MKSLIMSAVIAGSIAFSSMAHAAEQTITLAVENMYCASCPFIVKQSLNDVVGVSNVQVSYDDKTAIVTFDDTQTSVDTLTDTTSNAGYPSSVLN